MEEDKYKDEFEADVIVDPCKLAFEWNRNGVLHYKWSMRSAQAAYELKMAEQNYKITKAVIESEVRSDPTAFGLQAKATEGSIVMAIRLDERYLQAGERLADAMRTSKILDEAKDAMKFQRRAACQGFTQMLEKNYPGDAGESPYNAMEQNTKALNDE